jgi:hypothetical protein
MKPFFKTVGWCFTVFYLYQAALYLPEYFAPVSVMPCVTRLLDSYIVWFIFPMSFIMSGIVTGDIRSLYHGLYAGRYRWYIRARMVSGSVAVVATFFAAARIISAC